MVGDFLIVQMSDARDERVMAAGFCPSDRVMLRLRVVEDIICMVLDDIVRNSVPITPFRPRFNVYIGHVCLSLG